MVPSGDHDSGSMALRSNLFPHVPCNAAVIVAARVAWFIFNHWLSCLDAFLVIEFRLIELILSTYSTLLLWHKRLILSFSTTLLRLFRLFRTVGWSELVPGPISLENQDSTEHMFVRLFYDKLFFNKSYSCELHCVEDWNHTFFTYQCHFGLGYRKNILSAFTWPLKWGVTLYSSRLNPVGNGGQSPKLRQSTLYCPKNLCRCLW